MKKLLLSGFLASILCLTVSATGVKKPLIIELEINHLTTQSDLDRQVEFLKANGYNLTFEYVRFNKDGGVEAICGAVDFNKSYGTFETWDIGETSIVIKKHLLGQTSIRTGVKQ